MGCFFEAELDVESTIRVKSVKPTRNCAISDIMTLDALTGLGLEEYMLRFDRYNSFDVCALNFPLRVGSSSRDPSADHVDSLFLPLTSFFNVGIIAAVSNIMIDTDLAVNVAVCSNFGQGGNKASGTHTR